MKLLLLIPNFILLAISGYNLSIDFFNPEMKGSIVVTLLHLVVMAVCLIFIALIIKSIFVIKYIELPEQTQDTQRYQEINLQHSA